MSIVLLLFSVLAFLAGLLIFASAKSAIHEIEASQLFLISAVLFTGALIGEAIRKLLKQQMHTNVLLNYLATREKEKAEAATTAPINAQPPASPPPLEIQRKGDDVYRI
jgi:hypothetical protein